MGSKEVDVNIQANINYFFTACTTRPPAVMCEFAEWRDYQSKTFVSSASRDLWLWQRIGAAGDAYRPSGLEHPWKRYQSTLMENPGGVPPPPSKRDLAESSRANSKPRLRPTPPKYQCRRCTEPRSRGYYVSAPSPIPIILHTFPFARSYPYPRSRVDTCIIRYADPWPSHPQDASFCNLPRHDLNLGPAHAHRLRTV
jgi:hypothetical protein